MKKVAASILMILSISVYAEGPVFEQGRSPSGNLTCDPPIDRADGTALNLTDILHNVVTSTNTDTGTASTDITDSQCTLAYEWATMETGQYEVTARAVDLDGRESAESSVLSFVLIPQVAPPSAPSNLNIQ